MLVVDGDQIAQDSVRQVFSSMGCRTLSADNGKRALLIAESCTVELAWVDVRLVDMTAVEFMAALRERGVVIPVIVASSVPSITSAVEALKGGACDFVVKSESVQEYAAVVSRWIRPTQRVNPKVRRVLNTIQQRYAQRECTLRSLARDVGVAHEYLCRLIRRDTGRTFVAHLAEVRITQAKVLLRETSLSVKEVAAATGFESTTRIDRWFRKLHRCSPTEYRLSACPKPR